MTLSLDLTEDGKKIEASKSRPRDNGSTSAALPYSTGLHTAPFQQSIVRHLPACLPVRDQALNLNLNLNLNIQTSSPSSWCKPRDLCSVAYLRYANGDFSCACYCLSAS